MSHELQERLDTLERDVSLLAELWRASTGRGDLHVSNTVQERLLGLRPTFDRVSKESAGLDGPRVPRALLEAIAWTESHFDPNAIGPSVPNTDNRAYGLMQIWSGHFGDDLGSWPGGHTVRVSRDNWTDPEVSMKAAVLILHDCGWGRKQVREMIRCYSGARPGNVEAINEYSSRTLNRYVLLRFGPLLGLAP